MKYNRLGKSGLQVSALSLGSWLTFGKQIENNIAYDLMTTAYDNGINFFDNAEGYMAGESERVMGEILQKVQWERSSYLVSSKVFFGAEGKKPNQTGLSRKHVIEACHGALKRLQVSYLDLYFCHRPDRNTPIEETVWAMNLLIQQGKVLYWGTSEWTAQQITEAHLVAQKNHLIAPTMEQPQYNMLHRKRFELEYETLFTDFGMGSTIWSPLYSGVLSGKYNNGKQPESTRLNANGLDWLRDANLTPQNLLKVEKLSDLASDLGVSMANLAIAWCLKNTNVSTAILGASKLSQLVENLNSLAVVEKLTPEIMETIDKILDNKPPKPMF